MISPAAKLAEAAYGGDADEVKRLLEAGADPNAADEHGRTALTFAAGEGYVSILNILLSAGARADPHRDFEPYESPLVAAVTNGHLDAVQALVQAGANPDLHVGVSRRTAEIYAGLHGHVQILDYLKGLKRK